MIISKWMGKCDSNHIIQVNDPLLCCRLFLMNHSVPSKIAL